MLRSMGRFLLDNYARFILYMQEIYFYNKSHKTAGLSYLNGNPVKLGGVKRTRILRVPRKSENSNAISGIVQTIFFSKIFMQLIIILLWSIMIMFNANDKFLLLQQ